MNMKQPNARPAKEPPDPALAATPDYPSAAADQPYVLTASAKAEGQASLFVALIDWVKSFDDWQGRSIRGLKGRVRATAPSAEGENHADIGALDVAGVSLGLSIAWTDGEEGPALTLRIKARDSDAEGSVEIGSPEDWAVKDGSAEGDDTRTPPDETARLRLFDATIAPTLALVADRHRAAAHATPPRGDERQPNFTAAHALGARATHAAIEHVAAMAESILADLSLLPKGTPERRLIDPTLSLACAAREMITEDHEDASEEPDKIELLPEAPVEGAHRLYVVADVRQALQAAGDDTSSRSNLLKRLAAPSTATATRALVVADADTLTRIDALSKRAPHLAAVATVAYRYAAASMNTGMPLTLPPLVLLGSGGIGKTWFLSRLGEALGVPFRNHALSGSTLSEALQGSHAVYRNSHAGLVANTLLNETAANPLIFIDEFDKPGRNDGDPYRPFYVLMETEGARRFTDEYLGFNIDASRISWAVAVNSLDGIPPIVLDRMTVIETPSPTDDQMVVICNSIAAELNERLYDGYFVTGLAPEVSQSLIRRHPRGARKALADAMTNAAADGRRTLKASDVPVLAATSTARMGFVHH